MKATLAVAALAAAALYLGQNWRATPSAADDGLILDYIHQMALGQRPHFDMVDAYGVFNWILPVTLYQAAGFKIWGVRIAVLLIKLASVALGYRLVARLSDSFYGLLAALALVLLLGQPWQALQTAYAFLSALPLVLGAWYALLLRPSGKPWANALLAAVFTTLCIWTKLNTGLYLFAGGIVVLSCWPYAKPRRVPRHAAAPLVKWLQFAILIGVSGAFLAYVAGHFDWLYVPYLIAPLALGFGFAVVSAAPAHRSRALAALAPVGVYVGATLTLSGVVALGYYGLDGVAVYAAELSSTLTELRYQRPFPALGKPLIYVGLNENYWLQIPWLVTALFAAWLLAGRAAGERAYGGAWPAKRAATGGLFVLTTCYAFVLFPRSDDMHLFQALLLMSPALFVTVSDLDAFARAWRPSFGRYLRQGVLGASVIYGSTIAMTPRLDLFEPNAGHYANSRFEHLQYRESHDAYVRNFGRHMTSREWDTMLDAAARYIDTIAGENEPIFVMSDQRLLHSLSNTTSVGGRYAFYFYLVSTGLLDRHGFDVAVPGEVIEGILDNPPRVIAVIGERNPLVQAFPELRRLRDERYALTKVFRHVRVYELRATFPSDMALAGR